MVHLSYVTIAFINYIQELQITTPPPNQRAGQQAIYFGKSKIHIHSTKQKEPTLFQCTNNNCSFATFLFSFFCFSNRYFISSQHLLKYINISFRCKNERNIFQHKLTTKNDKIPIFLKTEETRPSLFFFK